MDLIELRVFAAMGILAIGVFVSTLAATAVALAEWIGRALGPRATRSAGARAVSRKPELGAGNARC
jgi:hypothetical protein